jgi:hypothetical protein
MKKGSSISIPAWRTTMDAALQKLPNNSFGSYSAAPDNVPPVIRGKWWGGESFFTDKISRKLATEYTPPETKEEHVITNPHNILYWIDKNNLTASKPGIGIADGQYKNWEASFQNWITTNGLGNIPPTPEKPTEFDDVHKPEFQPTVTIIKPDPANSITLNQETTIVASATSVHPIQKYEFYINDQFIGSVENSTNVSFQFIPSDYVTIAGTVRIKVVAIDDVFNKGEKTTEILAQ